MKKQYNLVKIISIMFFAFLTFFVMNKVHAENIITGDYVGKTYLKKEKAGHQSMYLRSQWVLRKSDNQFVYCLEPWVRVDSDQIYTYGTTDTYSKLSKEQMEKIKLAAYYGYGYEDHTDVDWYTITQLVIWQIADPEGDFYFTDTANGNRIEKFTNEQAELHYLIDRHNILPSFAGQSFTTSIGKTIDLDDSNLAMRYFEVASNNDIVVSKGDNNLSLSSNVNKSVQVDLVKKTNKYNSVPFVYFTENSQDVLTVGNFDEIRTYVKVTFESGSIKLLKRSRGSFKSDAVSLANAQYEVYDSAWKYIDTIVTNANGEGYINNLPYGRYFIKEKKASYGYELDLQTYSVVIDTNNLNKNLIVYEDLTKKDFEITKEYLNAITHKTYPEENIYFDIYSENGRTLIGTIQTDEMGKGSLSLPYGTYLVKQRNASYGYYKSDDFYITIDENTTKLAKKLTNQPILKDFEITKDYFNYIEQKPYPEEGIYFDIYTEDGSLLIGSILTNQEGKGKITLPYGTYLVKQRNATYGYYKVDDFYITIDDNTPSKFTHQILNQPILKDFEISKKYLSYFSKIKYAEKGIYFDIFTEDGSLLVGSILTNEEGKGTLTLPYGTYLVVQRNASYSFHKVDNFYITINDETEDHFTKELVNYPILKKLEITKEYLNALTKKTYPEEDIYFDIYTYRDNILVGTIKTNQKGYGYIMLPYGTYLVKQRNATYGYYKTEDFIIVINENTSYHLTKKLTNYPILKDFILNKQFLDQNTNQTYPEEGIYFDVYTKNGKFVMTIKTDNLGNATLKLPYGTYLIKQVNAKDGYTKSEDFYITIDDKTTTLKKNLINYPIIKEVLVPNTKLDEMNSWYFLIALLLTKLFIRKKVNL